MIFEASVARQRSLGHCASAELFLSETEKKGKSQNPRQKEGTGDGCR